jgi:hypothetical protein
VNGFPPWLPKLILFVRSPKHLLEISDSLFITMWCPRKSYGEGLI